MSMSQVFFYSGGLAVVVFSILAVTSKRLLRAAIYLLFVLIAVAGLYVILDFLFLAAVQVIVYAGGIVVLIIFSILLTSQLNEKLDTPNLWKRSISLIGAFGGIVATSLFISKSEFIQANPDSQVDYSVARIGSDLLNYGVNGYVLPFEVISILLLAAMVAAIIVAKRKKDTDD